MIVGMAYLRILRLITHTPITLPVMKISIIQKMIMNMLRIMILMFLRSMIFHLILIQRLIPIQAFPIWR